MTFVKCYNTSVANGDFTVLAKKLQCFFFMSFRLEKYWSLQQGLDVLIFEIVQCQRSVFFIGAYYVMC